MNCPPVCELTRYQDPHSSIVYILYQQAVSGRFAYSIAISDSFHNRSVAEDVTDDRNAAERFFQLLCAEGAEPCHLSDLVEDALPLC